MWVFNNVLADTVQDVTWRLSPYSIYCIIFCVNSQYRYVCIKFSQFSLFVNALDITVDNTIGYENLCPEI